MREITLIIANYTKTKLTNDAFGPSKVTKRLFQEDDELFDETIVRVYQDYEDGANRDEVDSVMEKLAIARKNLETRFKKDNRPIERVKR